MTGDSRPSFTQARTFQWQIKPIEKEKRMTIKTESNKIFIYSQKKIDELGNQDEYDTYDYIKRDTYQDIQSFITRGHKE